MENKQKEIIPIFFATDDNYVPILCVALKSLIANANKKYFYNIHILNAGLNKENFDYLKSFSVKNLVDIKFDNIIEKVENINGKLHTRDYYSKSTYYRFFIANLFPQYDKALYLDCDILIVKDIAELYNIDVGDNLVGAVNDETISMENVFAEYSERALGIDRYKYFNAGILLLNLKKFRLQNIEEKFAELLDRVTFSVAQDQDYLNVLCKDNVHYLDAGWNKVPIKYNWFNDDSLKLIHFKIIYRPWQSDDILYGEQFWKYARKCPCFKKIVQMKKSFTPEQAKLGKDGYENLKMLAIVETGKFEKMELPKKLSLNNI